jgi:hypothetical protein
MFDVCGHLDELRSWPTDRLVAHRDHLVREQRRLHLEDLDVVRVLDERGQIDPTVGAGGESAVTVRRSVETARALEWLPNVAAAAHAGELSDEQLSSVVQLADEDTDAEWARRAHNVAPEDLARLARRASTPPADDSRQRYEARTLRMWWTANNGMLHLHGQLPDVMGTTFEATIQQLTEQAKPSKGLAWDSFEHRAADALVGLCDGRDAAEHAPTSAAKPVLVVQVPASGPATIAGIPIADALVEQLQANATIEPVLVDDHGVPVARGRRTAVVSPKLTRAVRLRDGHCRVPGCPRRHGLQVHHLRPGSWGGPDELANLAAVCAPHHRLLIPHGHWVLLGNPNRPDGLHLVTLADLTPDQRQHLGVPPRRAGPAVA